MDLDLVKAAFAALRITPPARLMVLEAESLRAAHVPPFPPDCAALLIGVNSRELAVRLCSVLLAAYPATHEVFTVVASDLTTKARSHADTNQKSFVALSLGDLGVENDELLNFSDLTCVYLPPLEEGASFESLAEIVAHLRAPYGCPWDREQTHESLRTHLLEETYETLGAIDERDFAAMREEFGDLLLQTVLQTQIAAEAGEFTVHDSIKHIHDKLIRRHPHVFGGVEVEGVEHVLQNWEKLKEQERGKKKDGKGLLDGIPAALPALSQAQEYQDRAARVGFDWPGIDGVLDKIAEEIQEVKTADNPEHLNEELGDLLFALVNLVRWKKLNAESALRETNIKFKRRFRHVEEGARARAKPLTELSLEEMDALWEEGKLSEAGGAH